MAGGVGLGSVKLIFKIVKNYRCEGCFISIIKFTEIFGFLSRYSRDHCLIRSINFESASKWQLPNPESSVDRRHMTFDISINRSYVCSMADKSGPQSPALVGQIHFAGGFYHKLQPGHDLSVICATRQYTHT